MPINDVRNTVLAIANKNNYGYISPQDFNLYAQQSQMDIFEDYFYQYNTQLTKENQRMSGTGYADITKGLVEVIDYFSVTRPLSLSLTPPTLSNVYYLPSQATTGSDYYLMNKVLVYTTLLASGKTTGTSGGNNAIIDTNATFITSGVKVGSTVSLVKNGITQYVTVTQIQNENKLVTTDSINNTVVWDALLISYNIYNSSGIQEAEKVTHSKITMLNNSTLTAPSIGYPAYLEEGLILTAFPDSINNMGRVFSQYIRYPYTPKWTYVSITLGEPMFDASQADYQDFELPLSDEPALIAKICKYVGLEIREADVYAFGTEALANEQQTQA